MYKFIDCEYSRKELIHNVTDHLPSYVAYGESLVQNDDSHLEWHEGAKEQPSLDWYLSAWSQCETLPPSSLQAIRLVRKYVAQSLLPQE